jgi:hypothetical protein
VTTYSDGCGGYWSDNGESSEHEEDPEARPRIDMNLLLELQRQWREEDAKKEETHGHRG